MNNQSQTITILSAEDDPDDRVLVRDAFQESGQGNSIYFVEDGLELLQYLQRVNQFSAPNSAPRPDLILLDLNMPHMDGKECLAEIKTDPKLRSIPVVVLSGSANEQDIRRTYDLGSAGYIVKPGSFQGMVEVIQGLSQYWFHIVELINDEQVNGTTNHHLEAIPSDKFDSI